MNAAFHTFAIRVELQELKASGVNHIIKYGVAFGGKHVAVVSESSC